MGRERVGTGRKKELTFRCVWVAMWGFMYWKRYEVVFGSGMAFVKRLSGLLHTLLLGRFGASHVLPAL